MKKILPLLVFLGLSFFVLSNPPSSKAASTGPVDVQQLSVKEGDMPGTVVLSWTQSNPTTSAYHVVYGEKSTVYIYSALNVPSLGVGIRQNFTVGALVPGKTYYFALVPVRGGVPTVPTMEVSIAATEGVSSSAVSAASSSGPVGINGLRAYPGPDNGQVTLEWARATLTGENYSIHYGTQPGKYPYLADHVGYVASYTVSNLVPGQKYYFTLERIQTGNVSIGSSGEVSAVASAGSIAPVITSGPIGRNLLVATQAGSGMVKLSWNQFFSDSNGWHIVYGTKPGQYQYGVLNAVSTTAGTTSYSFTVGALHSGQRYYFAIVPIRGGQAQYITAEVSIVAQ